MQDSCTGGAWLPTQMGADWGWAGGAGQGRGWKVGTGGWEGRSGPQSGLLATAMCVIATGHYGCLAFIYIDVFINFFS